MDQKCAHYFLKTRGSVADDCFMFSKTVTRTLWKDFLVGAPGLPGNPDSDQADTLKFKAGSVNPEIKDIVPWLSNAIVVPPLFHLLQHIRQYTFSTFCFSTNIKEEKKFDKLCAKEGPTFHGHKYESGEARRAVSYAEPILTCPVNGFPDDIHTIKDNIHLFALLHEFQMMIYCSFPSSETGLLRAHVIPRMLGEAVYRIQKGHLRHVYWANAYIAIPEFQALLLAAGFNLCDVLEEAFEQDFLIRKNHFSEKRGQLDLRVMHFKANERAKKRTRQTKHRCEQFELRTSNFRNVKVRTCLLQMRSWVDSLKSRFPNLVILNVENGVEFVTFLCAERNNARTSNASICEGTLIISS